MILFGWLQFLTGSPILEVTNSENVSKLVETNALGTFRPPSVFESSFQYVPYVECGVPGSREEAPLCKDAGIKHFPTWQFADGERLEGTLPLQTLATKTGCSLP